MKSSFFRAVAKPYVSLARNCVDNNMNLALLNPFRQADRIDSTLSIPRALHPPRPSKAPPIDGSSNDVEESGGASVAAANKKSSGKKTGKKKGGTKKSNKSTTAKRNARGKKTTASAAAATSSAVDLFEEDHKNATTTAATVAEEGYNDSSAIMDDRTIDDDDSSARSNLAVSNNKNNNNDDDDLLIIDEITSVTSNNNKQHASRFHDNIDEESSDEGSESYWTACYAVSFNRRGSFLASGHASGLVPVHDFLGRTVCALYRPPIISTTTHTESPMDGKKVGRSTKKKRKRAEEEEEEEDDDKLAASSNRNEESLVDCPPSTPAASAAADHGGEEVGAVVDYINTLSIPAERTSVSTDNNDMIPAEIPDVISNIIVGCTSGDNHNSNNTNNMGEDFNDDYDDTMSNINITTSSLERQVVYLNGVTSLSWDRHSRTLLAGAIGDRNLRLMDNTCPSVATDCTFAIRKQFLASNKISNINDNISGNNRIENNTSSEKAKKVSDIAQWATIPPPPPGYGSNNSSPGFKDTMMDNSRSSGASGDEARIIICKETASLGTEARLLRCEVVDAGMGGYPYSIPLPQQQQQHMMMMNFKNNAIIRVPSRRYPTLVLELPQPLGGPVQLHPHDSHAGLVCMMDGSLALFWLPPVAYHEALSTEICTSDNNKTLTGLVNEEGGLDDNSKGINMEWVVESLEREERSMAGNLAYIVAPPPPILKLEENGRPPQQPQYFITCATFGKNTSGNKGEGDIIWAVTRCGKLLAYRINPAMMNLLRGRDDDTFLASVLLTNRLVRPILIVPVAGSAAAWQIIISKNGKFLLINSADCTLRLYNVDELISNFVDDAISTSSNLETNDQSRSNDDNSPPPPPPPIVEPRFNFQDNISRAPWASCDFYNGDEYVCGGCNSYPQPGESYNLFLWNCITGELVDQLTGPASSLYSLSCHPTRPFIAVGTSDGIVDIWGARLDWVAFAPDFQALEQNEVYEEREDEFDIVNGDDEVDIVGGDEGLAAAENDDVDIVSVAKVPIFDSDSEDEKALFYFGSTVEKILSDKQPLTHQH